MSSNLGISLDQIRQFVSTWNISYPIDYWWRKKYNIPFNSAQHRAASFIDMRIEYEEQLFIDQLTNSRKDEYKPGYGQWLKKQSQELSQQQVDDLFDKVDLSTLDFNADKSLKIS